MKRDNYGAPSYHEHNERSGKQRKLPDVLPAEFEPPTFEIREGVVIQESPRLTLVGRRA